MNIQTSSKIQTAQKVKPAEKKSILKETAKILLLGRLYISDLRQYSTQLT